MARTIEDFCVFILSHGRPDNVVTYSTLQKYGYTGPLYIIIDNEDKSADRYRELYGDKVIVFDKAATAQTFDEGDNFNDRRAVVYARNASFKIARDLGYTYFMQLDDDYPEAHYRYMKDGGFRGKDTKDITRIFGEVLEYYKTIPALSVALMQDGDLIGGLGNNFMSSLRRRKCMNSFLCSVDRPFQFIGRINEDVNAYIGIGSRGGLFMTMTQLSFRQAVTQQNSGGLTDIYLSLGTYVKSFYTVLYSPSCVRVEAMGSHNRRLHHRISWKHAVPQIIREEHRKVTSHEAKP